MQWPGMAAVPDLFRSADGGIVVVVDLPPPSSGGGTLAGSLPRLQALLDGGEAAGVHEVAGSRGKELMRRADPASPARAVPAAELRDALRERAAEVLREAGGALRALAVRVEEGGGGGGGGSAGEAVDEALASSIRVLSEEAARDGRTLVLHVVVDEGAEAAGTASEGRNGGGRRGRRRLEDGDGGGNNGGADDDQYSAYASSEYTRTIFQIQYYNVVLWTALGLILVLVTSLYMMMYMPLMPDTLLFGQSAKMVGE